jgi:hypothetical protein
VRRCAQGDCSALGGGYVDVKRLACTDVVRDTSRLSLALFAVAAAGTLLLWALNVRAAVARRSWPRLHDMRCAQRNAHHAESGGLGLRKLAPGAEALDEEDEGDAAADGEGDRGHARAHVAAQEPLALRTPRRRQDDGARWPPWITTC